MKIFTNAPTRKPPAMNLSSSRIPLRLTARQREERRIRIMAMVRSGLFSYDAIAREHKLTRARIRQIVVASAPTERSGARVEQMRVRMARLEPALRLAARGVENGQLNAIGPLLQVLDLLDKYRAYGSVVEAPPPYDENAREKRLAKLDRAVARLGISNGASPPTGACAAGARRCRGETFPPHKPLKNHES
jgi:hypothetical protein